MARYQDITTVLYKMKSNGHRKSFLRDLDPELQFTEKNNLQRILELLNATNDINLQTKLFSVISANLMFNQKNVYFEEIIKSSAVYDKVHNVLAKGPPRNAVDALNFLSALLYLDPETDGVTTKKRALVLLAKNMIRISGCLGAITDIFTESVMYYDTWKALCQCLATVCSDCETNQSYCSHLIPLCIRKCNQTNIDVFLVLQSLLLNHNRNIQLFLETNGLSIFNRELLHYDKSLLLLTTLVQCPRASSLLLRETKLMDDLRDFVRLYGSDSQIGQKAMIILYHIESRSKVRGNITKLKQPTRITRMDAGTSRKLENELDDTKILMQNVMKEVFNCNRDSVGNFKETTTALKENLLTRDNTTSKNKHIKLIPSALEKSSIICDNTTSKRSGFKQTPPALQVSPIIIRDKAASKNRYCKQTAPALEMSSIIRDNEYSKNGQMCQRNFMSNTNKLMSHRKQSSNYNTATEVSFSIFQNHAGHGYSKNINDDRNETFYFNNHSTETNKVNNKTHIRNIEKGLPDLYKTTSNGKPMPIESNFIPIFSSTPKPVREISYQTDYSEPSVFSKTAMSMSRMIAQRREVRQRKTKMQKRRPKITERKKDKDLKNRSLSSRFFSAINGSCTALLKTVANVFKRQDSLQFSDNSTGSRSTRAEDHRSGSNSFHKYMKQREAGLKKKVLKDKNGDYSEFNLGTKSCDTCDDTEVLRKKLIKDAHLKQTVKKLKLGINLFGCDFKKISRTMWPRESYMTPLVLYNLYRKLILK